MPLFRAIPCFCLAIAAPLACAQSSPATTPTPEEIPALRKIPAISVLPDGSELDGVILPRYDQYLRLTGSLHAGKLTLVGPEIIRGDDVHIQFIDPDRANATTHITLGTAILDQIHGIIRADQHVTIRSDRFAASGSALHLAFEENRGFVSGPATTTLFASPSTAMHLPKRSSHPMLATAAAGVAVATSAMVQARPPAVSTEELANLRRDAAPVASQITARAAETRNDAAATAELSEDLSNTARTFLINQVLPEGAPAPEPPVAQKAEPLDIEPTPQDTRILSDDGFYFDADAGILVYLGNVRVTDPRFSLDGVDELKILFAKKSEPATDNSEPTKPKPADDAPASGFAAGVGEVERIIATGRVRFLQRQSEDDKPPVEASGALFNYQVNTGEIILSGGYPWVRQGGYYARALQPNLSLRIRRNGSFVTEGNWDTGQNLRR